MQGALVVMWDGAVPGRERQMLAFSNEATEWWAKRAAEGRCSAPIFLHGSSGLSVWLVTGEEDELYQLSKDAADLIAAGRVVALNYRWEFMTVGDSSDAYFARWVGALERLGVMQSSSA